MSVMPIKDILLSVLAPVKTKLVPVITAYQPFISWDSVAPRICSMIAWHFIPGVEYQLYVYPGTDPATVTINMSTSGSNGNWVYNQDSTSFTEKNIISGGQTEVYNFANQIQPYGIYKITISTNITNLGVTFSDAEGISPNQSEVKTINNSGTFTNKTFYFTGSTQTN